MDKKNIVLVVLAVALIALVWFVMFKPVPEAPAVATAPVAELPEPVQREQPVEPEEPKPMAPVDEPGPSMIPPPETLSGSDSAWRELVQSLVPSMTAWLVDEEMIRKWVILVDQIADGDISNKHLPLAYPMAAFAVEGNKDAAKIDPANYQRAQALIDAVTSVEPETLVSYYRLWQPLFDQAYAELGKPGKFDDRVVQAIRQLQGVPVGPVDAEIAMRPVMYKYSDSKFEKAPALHKWMWRLGPDNQFRIKQYLTEVKLALYRQS